MFHAPEPYMASYPATIIRPRSAAPVSHKWDLGEQCTELDKHDTASLSNSNKPRVGLGEEMHRNLARYNSFPLASSHSCGAVLTISF
jgi:hypothetical protein